MDRPEILARMPLADAVMSVWSWVATDERLQAIWDANRGRNYDRVITFPTMVSLIKDSLVQNRGAQRVFEESKELEASIQAAYGKLARLPIAVSEAFLSECTAALREIFPEWATWQGPHSLRAFQVVILDGKAVKRGERRIKNLRGVAGSMIAGRALVALDWTTGLATCFRGDPDGHCNEVKYTSEVVEMARQQIGGPRLWVADRAFTDLIQTAAFTSEDGDHFLCRYSARVPWTQDRTKRVRKSKDEHGRTIVETFGWLGKESRADRRYVRRIEIKRRGKSPIVLITDLLDSKKYPAEDLAWLYSERWGIERVFQEVTEVFGLDKLIGTRPEAAIFQFAFCLLLYNLIQVVRGYIAQSQDKAPDEISSEKLFQDLRRQLIAWHVTIDLKTSLEYFATVRSRSQLVSRLERLLGNTWSPWWKKAPKQAVHRKTKIKRKLRAHNSVYRLINSS